MVLLRFIFLLSSFTAFLQKTLPLLTALVSIEWGNKAYKYTLLP